MSGEVKNVVLSRKEGFSNIEWPLVIRSPLSSSTAAKFSCLCPDTCTSAVGQYGREDSRGTPVR